MTSDGTAPANNSRRTFLKVGASAVAVGIVGASALEVPFLGTSAFQKHQQVTSLQSQVTSLQQQVSQTTTLTKQVQSLATSVNVVSGFLYLSVDEQPLLESVVETIIPTDSNGPGAEEAGVIYFIDRALYGDYGSCGNMYMQGPFVKTGLAGPLTVQGIVYPAGTPTQGVDAGTNYQYSMMLRDFWRTSLAALQQYSNAAYGANFQALPVFEREMVLTDLWNNKPEVFSGVVPADFAWELFMMTWAGFLMDPLYGGNRNMVGWVYTGFNGTNQGNFYGEGHSPLELATSSVPIRLKPASLAQFQQAQPIL